MRANRRCFRLGAAALCGVGLLVLWLGYGLVLNQEGRLGDQRRKPPAELRLLQPLVTGNLAVFLTWVWLDVRSRERGELAGEGRFELWFVAALVAVVSMLAGAAWTDLLASEVFFPFTLSVGAPVLIVAVPLLWLAARRIGRPWLRALVLGGVVAASAITQLGYGVGTDAEMRVFTLNSCLIGLAVAVWLVTWAATPELRRIA